MESVGDTFLAIILAGLAIFGLIGGLAALLFAPTVARWNDTKGPSWVRNWNGQAFPGRTKPWHMRLVSVLLIPIGVFSAWCAYLLATGHLR